jgi:hypothetical protein
MWPKTFPVTTGPIGDVKVPLQRTSESQVFKAECKSMVGTIGSALSHEVKSKDLLPRPCLGSLAFALAFAFAAGLFLGIIPIRTISREMNTFPPKPLFPSFVLSKVLPCSRSRSATITLFSVSRR